MSKPDHEQLDIALVNAERLRDLGEDDFFLGRTVLYLQRRNEVLEQVLDAATHYLNSGHEQLAHSNLLKAVEEARRQAREDSTSLEENSSFGLE